MVKSDKRLHKVKREKQRNISNTIENIKKHFFYSFYLINFREDVQGKQSMLKGSKFLIVIFEEI